MKVRKGDIRSGLGVSFLLSLDIIKASAHTSVEIDLLTANFAICLPEDTLIQITVLDYLFPR